MFGAYRSRLASSARPNMDKFGYPVPTTQPITNPEPIPIEFDETALLKEAAELASWRAHFLINIKKEKIKVKSTPEPTLKPESVPETTVEPEPAIEPEHESIIELEPEPTIESTVEPKPVSEPEHTIESEPEPVVDFKPATKSESKSEPHDVAHTDRYPCPKQGVAPPPPNRAMFMARRLPCPRQGVVPSPPGRPPEIFTNFAWHDTSSKYRVSRGGV